MAGHAGLLIDADLRILEHATHGPIPFRVELEGYHADYFADIVDGRVSHRAQGVEATVVRPRGMEIPLSEYLDQNGTELHFEDEVVVHGSAMYELQRTLPPIDPDKLHPLDWTGIDITRESQGPQRDPSTVQARAAQHLQTLADWEVIVDDDGTGEIADLVAMREEGDRLLIHLVHCKYSSEQTPGARVGDLYEVCGQAQRSAHHRQHATAMVTNLIRRERARRAPRGDRAPTDGLLVGTDEALFDYEEKIRRRQTTFHISIVQPGLSTAALADRHRQVLAATDVYVSEIAYGRFDVWCSA